MVDQEALTSGRVPRCMEKLDVDFPHLQRIAAVVCLDIAVGNPGYHLDSLCLGGLHVNGDGLFFEQAPDALHLHAEHRAANVIRVVMRREHANQTHVIGCQQVEQTGDVA